nr:RNA polymerase factor sigma-54 [Comamonas sp.]
MKPGLSLRVSQHLALTPQLQQSIRLLQLSTLELSQEVEQMLDENPFLEVANDEAPSEEFGVASADAAPEYDAHAADEAQYSIAEGAGSTSTEGQKEQDSSASENDLPSDWEGDGSVDMAFDDSEWGGDALPRGTRDDDDAPTALELAGSHESLTDFLHQQSLSLRLSQLDRYALRFLIENLNDDGYLEDSLEELALGLAGSEDLEQLEELVH